ncbi:MAG TPA: hypothetical protein VJJ75_00090 [Candidatus Nanoarchaeia archaeon]|nr:hypothetical protein [Candidatus Nanoarchaeia archaeon]
MKNPFKTIDMHVMDGVNQIAHAWNWTTGRTKSDLARICYISYPGIISGGFFLNRNYFLSALWAAHWLLLTPRLCKISSDLEKRENESIEKGAMDIGIPVRKNIIKFTGYALASITLANSLVPYSHSSEESFPEGKDGLLTAGLAVNALGYFINLADPLPPRKHVLARAKDKLVDMIRSYNLQPGMRATV